MTAAMLYYDDAVCVSPDYQSSLVALSASGAGATTLVSGLHSVKGLAVDATTLYFIDVATQYGPVAGERRDRSGDEFSRADAQSSQNRGTLIDLLFGRNEYFATTVSSR